MLSTPELIIIFLVIMLVFGGTRLPAVGRGLGEGVRQFRDGLRGSDTPPPPPVASQEAQPPKKDAAPHASSSPAPGASEPGRPS